MQEPREAKEVLTVSSQYLWVGSVSGLFLNCTGCSSGRRFNKWDLIGYASHFVGFSGHGLLQVMKYTGWIFCGLPVAARDNFGHHRSLEFTQPPNSLFWDHGRYSSAAGRVIGKPWTEGDCALLGKDAFVAVESLPSQLTQDHCLGVGPCCFWGKLKDVVLWRTA